MNDPIPAPSKNQVAAPSAKTLRTWTWIGGGLAVAGATGMVVGGGVLSILALGLGLVTVLATALATRSFAAPHRVDRHARLRELRRYISKTRYLENVGDLGERTAHQVERAIEQYEGFVHLLQLKFAPTELTYSRYYDAGEQAFLSILDNLTTVATSLQGLNATDVRRLDARLAQLAAPGTADPAAEIKELRTQKDEREREVGRINELLAGNERAFSEFSRVRAALSKVQTRKGEADVDLDAAMAQLNEMARRADKYGKV